MKTTPTAMNTRENKMRNPKNSGVVKGGGPKLVIAIGMAPTLGKGKGSNKLAQRIKK